MTAFDTRRAMEAWAREHGWPVDRPWVKPHHALNCVCWRCVPHIVHAEPHFTAWRHEYAYPCGLVVATTNALQDERLLAGATHSRTYDSVWSPVTCPGCRAADANVCTDLEGRTAHAEH